MKPSKFKDRWPVVAAQLDAVHKLQQKRIARLPAVSDLQDIEKKYLEKAKELK